MENLLHILKLIKQPSVRTSKIAIHFSNQHAYTQSTRHTYRHIHAGAYPGTHIEITTTADSSRLGSGVPQNHGNRGGDGGGCQSIYALLTSQQ